MSLNLPVIPPFWTPQSVSEHDVRRTRLLIHIQILGLVFWLHIRDTDHLFWTVSSGTFTSRNLIIWGLWEPRDAAIYDVSLTNHMSSLKYCFCLVLSVDNVHRLTKSSSCEMFLCVFRLNLNFDWLHKMSVMLSLVREENFMQLQVS